MHVHGIIAYRNIIDYNKNIINNIYKNLKKSMYWADVVLKPLDSFKDIKQWVQYLHKDKVLVFPPHFEIMNKYLDEGDSVNGV
jgi:hypothetical protein